MTSHVKPKKVLHFSDGVEEFSDDNDEVDGPGSNQEVIDETTMQWGPWLLLKSRQTGESILHGCDYVGEFLASALGITSPKFIDGEEELRKAEAEQKERDEEAAEEEREMSTWKVNGNQQATATITEQQQQSPPVLIMKDEVENKPPERY